MWQSVKNGAGAVASSIGGYIKGHPKFTAAAVVGAFTTIYGLPAYYGCKKAKNNILDVIDILGNKIAKYNPDESAESAKFIEEIQELLLVKKTTRELSFIEFFAKMNSLFKGNKSLSTLTIKVSLEMIGNWLLINKVSKKRRVTIINDIIKALRKLTINYRTQYAMGLSDGCRELKEDCLKALCAAREEVLDCKGVEQAMIAGACVNGAICALLTAGASALYSWFTK